MSWVSPGLEWMRLPASTILIIVTRESLTLTEGSSLSKLRREPAQITLLDSEREWFWNKNWGNCQKAKDKCLVYIPYESTLALDLKYRHYVIFAFPGLHKTPKSEYYLKYNHLVGGTFINYFTLKPINNKG